MTSSYFEKKLGRKVPLIYVMTLKYDLKRYEIWNEGLTDRIKMRIYLQLTCAGYDNRMFNFWQPYKKCNMNKYYAQKADYEVL